MKAFLPLNHPHKSPKTLYEEAVLVAEGYPNTNSWTVGRDLVNGHSYNWKCRVHNPGGWGPFFTPNQVFTVNAPVPASPPWACVVNTVRPSFWVESVSNVDWYRFLLYESNVLVWDGWSTTNGATVGRDLLPGHTYNWTCQVHWRSGSWSYGFAPNWNFTVTTGPQPAFPADGSFLNTNSVSLWVQSVSGANMYHFQLFERGVLVSEGYPSTNGWTIPRTLPDAHTYTWTCCAHTSEGWGPYFTPQWRFTIRAPTPAYPADGSTVNMRRPGLWVEPVSGVDWYRFLLYESGVLVWDDWSTSNGATLGRDLLNGHTYNWTCQVHFAGGGWSYGFVPYWTFSVSYKGDGGGGALAADSSCRALKFGLNAVEPNPFRAQTEVRYSLPAASDVRLTVYDLNGRLVRTLADGRQPAGEYTARCDLRGLARGVYLCRLAAGEFTETMTLIKQE